MCFLWSSFKSPWRISPHRHASAFPCGSPLELQHSRLAVLLRLVWGHPRRSVPNKVQCSSSKAPPHSGPWLDCPLDTGTFWISIPAEISLLSSRYKAQPPTRSPTNSDSSSPTRAAPLVFPVSQWMEPTPIQAETRVFLDLLAHSYSHPNNWLQTSVDSTSTFFYNLPTSLHICGHHSSLVHLHLFASLPAALSATIPLLIHAPHSYYHIFEMSVAVHMGSITKMPQTEGLNNRNVSLMVLEAKSGSAGLVSLNVSPLGLQMASFSLCPPTAFPRYACIPGLSLSVSQSPLVRAPVTLD